MAELPDTDFGLSAVLTMYADAEGIAITTEGIDDRIYGMLTSSDKDLRQVCRELALAYNFFIVDGDPIRLVRRDVNDDLIIDVTIDESECIRSSGRPVIEMTRTEPSRMPRQVEIQYMDPERDYAFNTQTARHTAAPLTNTNLSIQLDVVISSQQARALAFDTLYRLWAAQLSLRFEHKNCQIEPSDVILQTTTRGNFTCVVTRQRINMPARTNSIEAVVLLSSKGVSVAAQSADPFHPIIRDVEGTHVLAAGSAVFRLTASSALIHKSVHAVLAAGSASYSMSATDVSIIKNLRRVVADSASFNLSATDVTITQSGATDPDFASVVLLMGFEGANGSTGSPGFDDESSAAHGTGSPGAVGTVQISTSQFKFGSSSLDCTSAGSIYFPDSADFNFSNGQFTVEAFIRTPSSFSSTQFIVSQWFGDHSDLGWVLYLASGQLSFNLSTDGDNNILDMRDPTALSTNTWYHVAVDFDGTKRRLYVDGAMVASNVTARTIHDSDDPLYIGSDFGIGFFLNGYVDELRITKGVARYASDSGFTVPTAAYPRS